MSPQEERKRDMGRKMGRMGEDKHNLGPYWSFNLKSNKEDRY